MLASWECIFKFQISSSKKLWVWYIKDLNRQQNPIPEDVQLLVANYFTDETSLIWLFSLLTWREGKFFCRSSPIFVYNNWKKSKTAALY